MKTSSQALRLTRSEQWDSFRFCEALAAGCVPININLERHGVTPPSIPTSTEYYAGGDVDRPDATLSVLEDSSKLERMAASERAWALKHYSPVAQAPRLLAHCGLP